MHGSFVYIPLENEIRPKWKYPQSQNRLNQETKVLVLAQHIGNWTGDLVITIPIP